MCTPLKQTKNSRASLLLLVLRNTVIVDVTNPNGPPPPPPPPPRSDDLLERTRRHHEISSQLLLCMTHEPRNYWTGVSLLGALLPLPTDARRPISVDLDDDCSSDRDHQDGASRPQWAAAILTMKPLVEKIVIALSS